MTDVLIALSRLPWMAQAGSRTLLSQGNVRIGAVTLATVAPGASVLEIGGHPKALKTRVRRILKMEAPEKKSQVAPQAENVLLF